MDPIFGEGNKIYYCNSTQVVGNSNIVQDALGCSVIGIDNILSRNEQYPRPIFSSSVVGNRNSVSSNYSSAFGLGLRVKNSCCSAFGCYNNSGEDLLFSIGNGSDLDQRSNAFSVSEQGIANAKIFTSKERGYTEIFEISTDSIVTIGSTVAIESNLQVHRTRSNEIPIGVVCESGIVIGNNNNNILSNPSEKFIADPIMEATKVKRQIFRMDREIQTEANTYTPIYHEENGMKLPLYHPGLIDYKKDLRLDKKYCIVGLLGIFHVLADEIVDSRWHKITDTIYLIR